jgi:Domain of unknown function (DUF4357)
MSSLPVRSPAKTIQIFLPDGNPRSVRIAEITSRTIHAILIPRARLDYAVTREELSNVGIYFLIGTEEEQGRPLLYVGQAENCAHRIQRHNQKKDFWNVAIAIVSKTQTFTNTHIRYLEWLCHKQAKNAGRYELDNANAPKKPHISEPVEADLLDNFETLKMLVSTLGFPIFDEVSASQIEEILICKNKKAYARGKYTEEGLVVLKGSTANTEETPSARKWIKDLRRRLVDSGVLVQDGDVYKFTADHLFAAPSGAAVAVIGKSANGWKCWKYENGKTLDEVKRQSSEDDEAAE